MSNKDPETIECEGWAKAVLHTLFSPQWNEVRKNYYSSLKDDMNQDDTVSEDIFLHELLGAQLQVLDFVCAYTHEGLGKELKVSKGEFLSELDEGNQSRVSDSYEFIHQKVIEQGKSDESLYDIVADAFAQRCNLKNSPNITSRLPDDFFELGDAWKNQFSQYKFVE